MSKMLADVLTTTKGADITSLANTSPTLNVYQEFIKDFLKKGKKHGVGAIKAISSHKV